MGNQQNTIKQSKLVNSKRHLPPGGCDHRGISFTKTIMKAVAVGVDLSSESYGV